MLTGIRVLDCCERPGWLAGRLLADLGAQVTKIESPDDACDAAEWRALNINKRLLRLDLLSIGGVREFERLVRETDILLATFRPGSDRARWFDHARLSATNPRLIGVAITPFGLTGPKSRWLASDIELMAAGGAMSLAGAPDGMPLRVSAPQSHAWTGAQAVVGALTALEQRARSGRGHLVDVSGQSAVITALAHAPTFADIAGQAPTRAGAFITGRSVHGARFRVFWSCRDGYLNFILYGGTAGRRTNEQLVAWMRERKFDPGALGAIEWSKFDPTRVTQEQVDEIERPIGSFFAGVTKREFLEQAHRREMLGYPVSTVADIAADPQLAARGFWQDVALPDGRRERHCAPFAVVDGVRAPLVLGGHEGHAGAQPEPRPLAREPAVHAAGSLLPQALAGLRIVEFGGYAAGPHIGKMLANFGATVVHVESRSRPDGFRLQYPPYKGGRPGIDSGGCFAYFNDSKYAVTLDLKNPHGLELARKLAGWTDLVIENMRPGVMDRIGLGYAMLREANPGLIMLSTCNMGQTGPRADTPGFGSQLTALAGMCGLTGEPQDSPNLLYGPYIDFIASTLGAAAALAALERRRRCGIGAFIDVSQYECGLMFLAGPLLEYHCSGAVAERAGNRDTEAAPHGAYRCADGEWLALSCWSDAQFAALAGAIGDPALARNPLFSDPSARHLHAVALDRVLATWAGGISAKSGAELLQRSDVPAHPVSSVGALFSDPQLLARRQWRRRRHAVIGEQAYCFPAYDLPEIPGDITAPGPLLGEHNETVFGGFLGMAPEEIEAYRAAGAFD